MTSFYSQMTAKVYFLIFWKRGRDREDHFERIAKRAALHPPEASKSDLSIRGLPFDQFTNCAEPSPL
jgi:hypothetical protein